MRCLLAVLIAVVCGITLGNGAPAMAQEPASPATGHAQIIAHGVVPIPAGNIGWRVLSRDSSPDDVAATAGFLLADRGVVLVTDQETRDLFRLAPGMALLTRDGEHQQRTSAEAGAARYYAIELVPASLPRGAMPIRASRVTRFLGLTPCMRSVCCGTCSPMAS